jgi:hypothetical protein
MAVVEGVPQTEHEFSISPEQYQNRPANVAVSWNSSNAQ